MDGHEMREIRESLGLSQADFGARLGLSRDYIGAMERGARQINPRMAKLVRETVPAVARAGDRPKPVMTDPMERIIEHALIDAGIRYVADWNGADTKGLDFWLPDHDVYIEVKRFHTDRIAAQMQRATNVIALQGEAAIRLFADMLRPGFTDARAFGPDA